MVSCFAPCCKSGYNGQKTHSFGPDSSVSNEWIKILKKIRADKHFDPKNKNHKLCHLHFVSDVLIKEDKFTIKSEIVTTPRIKWKLAVGAIPTIFPELPSYRQITLPKKRTISTEKPIIVPKALTQLESLELALKSEVDWRIFLTSIDKIKLIQFSCGKEKIVEVYENSTIKIYFEARDVTEALSQKYAKIKPNIALDPAEIKLLLDEIATLKQCQGIKGYEKITEIKTGFKESNIWYSTSCVKIGKAVCCTPCKLLHPKLCKKLFSSYKIKPKNTLTKIKEKKEKINVRNLKKRLKNAAKTSTKLKMKLRKMEITLKHANTTSIENFLNSDKISRPFATAVTHAVKLAKLKCSKGIRYSIDWLLECLLLKIKSPGAYKHIRNSKMLPLPHPSTLSRLIAGQQCQFGFNQISLDSIQLALKDKMQRDRQGTLIFDEIHLRETMDFNKGTKKFDGFIDYAEYSEELLSKQEKTTLADHALVLMFRPLTSNWVQPIAAFATKGAAKGNALQKVIIEAIIKLDVIGAEVVCFVADGAKTNKNFWKRLGISGNLGQVVNKIIHPCDDKRFLYFLCDVPHLIKCIRNHIRKYLSVQFDGKSINFSFYEKLLAEDKKRQCGLRKCPKLTQSHISPNSFEKMNVSLATQLFSRSVSTGLQFYREQNVCGFEQAKNTEIFTQKMNDLFDALNCKFKNEGIRLGSSQMKDLKWWLSMLETPPKPTPRQTNEKKRKLRKEQNTISHNTFASSETLSALRLTIKSVIEIIEYLISDRNFNYVLTNKLNQDPCEKFFGLVRGAGGHEDHPTVCNFLQLYRILSLYTPTKKILKGNISPGGNETVLVSFQESLKSSAKQVASRKKEWKDEINQVLLTKISKCQVISDGCPSLDANIVYYLAGYVVRKSRKFSSCESCLLSIETTRLDNLPDVADLSKIMDYGTFLKYPSISLFKLICFVVEPALVKMITNGDLYGDIVKNILCSLNNFSVENIGCNEETHKFELICKIIPFYVTTRLYFHVKSFRNDVGHGKATKHKRKLSKLQSK